MFELIVIGACIVLILLPPKHDPLIRWKEFNEAWRKRLDDR